MIIALLVYGLMPVSFFLIGLGRGLFSGVKDPSNFVASEPEQLPGTSPEQDIEANHQAPSDQPAGTKIIGDGLSRNRWLFLVTWTGFTLLLTLAYPGRQVADLTLTLVLIWSVAASEMAVDLFPYRDQQERDTINLPVAIILAIFILILMALFWFTLSALSRYTPSMGVDPSSLAGSVRWIVPLGTLILIALTSILVCLGWSFRTGGKGFFWGITTALLIYTIAVLWGSAYLRPNQPEEFWSMAPGTGNAHLLHQTLNTLSLKETGFKGFLDIAVLVDSPSLRWELRDYSQTTFVMSPGSSTNQAPDLSLGTNLAGEQPAIVITSLDQELPALSAAYSGQDFVWWTWQGWEGDIPPNFIRWLNYREAPVNNAKIILWVRADIIRDEEPAPTEETSPDEGSVPSEEIPYSGES